MTLFQNVVLDEDAQFLARPNNASMSKSVVRDRCLHRLTGLLELFGKVDLSDVETRQLYLSLSYVSIVTISDRSRA
jgi:hypothetical protein